MTSTNATCASRKTGTPATEVPASQPAISKTPPSTSRGAKEDRPDERLGHVAGGVLRDTGGERGAAGHALDERDGLAHLLAFVVPVDGVAQSVEFREQVVDVRVCGAVRRGVGIV